MTHSPGLPCVSEATEGQEQEPEVRERPDHPDVVACGRLLVKAMGGWKLGADAYAKGDREESDKRFREGTGAAVELKARLRSLVTELETYRKVQAAKQAWFDATKPGPHRSDGTPILPAKEAVAVPDVPFPHDADECQCGECQTAIEMHASREALCDEWREIKRRGSLSTPRTTEPL